MPDDKERAASRTPEVDVDVPRDARIPLGEGAGELARVDVSGETSERDLKPGQRRRGGQDVQP